MARRFALQGIVLSTLVVAAAYASAFLPGGAPPWAPWALAFGTAGVMVSMMILGAQRQGRVGHLRWAFLLVFLIVAGGFALLLSLPAPAAGARLFGGLPAGAAVLVYVVGLLPFFVVPFAYAWTFDEMTLSPEDLARARAVGAAARHAAAQRTGDGAAAGPGSGAVADAGSGATAPTAGAPGGSSPAADR